MLRIASLCAVTAAVCTSISFAGFLNPNVAQACGGCFAPPPTLGQPSVVTAHRMVVALSDTETTLWDQFEYAGDPEDFVWVLPVAGGQEVQVDLADQSFFLFLQRQSAITLQGPTPPFRGGGGSGFGCGDSAAVGGGPGTTMTPVTVYASDVVGPYETVTIGSEDAGSLVGWLQDHDYAVPDELTPTIMHYVDQGMNFVVLRLSPNSTVNQMQPVRVTTPGLGLTFPLRMIAAGVADDVSLELHIIAEGRWEAQNFPNAQIDENELTFDWNDNSFDWDAVASEKLAADDGRTWLTEFSQAISVNRLALMWTDFGTDEEHDATEDWDVATRNLRGDVTLTRMRAVLPVTALDQDLILQASELGARRGFYDVQNELNRPSAAPLALDIGDTSSGAMPYLVFFGVAALSLSLRRKLRRSPQ